MRRHIITNSNNLDFLKLVKQLDSDLYNINGEEQAEYDKHNVLDFIDSVVLIYENESAIACGAFKEYDNSTVEIKRVFVIPEYRGHGISKELMVLLEEEAVSRSYKRAILETGREQSAALGLYKRCEYTTIENYPPYVGLVNSICMERILNQDI